MKTTKLPKDKAKARVLIAKDVIAQLDARKLEAGGFYQIICHGIDRNADAKSHLPAKCRVCAKGAVLLAHIERFNSVTVGEALNANHETAAAKATYFSVKQLDEIEAAFEGGFIGDAPSPTAEKTAYRWATRYPHVLASDHFHRNDRLRAIMSNIIRNKGTFKFREVVPPKRKRVTA